MSIFGTGTSDFANLSGLEESDYASFNDIEVTGNIYLKQPDIYNGYNSVMITNHENISNINFENNIVNNLTGFNDNWMITLGTGQDTFEPILKVNPTTGLHFEANNNDVNIDWNELSYLNGARSNLQTQIDNLDPDLSSNQGYWGNFWNGNTITNSSANAINTISFPSADANNYAITIQNNNRVTLGNAGIYMFIATIQINKSQGSTDEDIYFWIRKIGVDVADTAFKETIKAEPILATANWQLKMNAGDYFQLMWSSPDIHVQLVAYGTGTTPTKPAIPSVILSVSQVSFLVSGGAGLLPLTYNSPTNNLICDASFQVVGNTNLTNTLTSTGNALFSGNTFSYTKTSTSISIPNRNWIDGSGNIPTTNTFTTMFSNVKNQTIDVSGWRFSGTAISSINGYQAIWVNGTLTGFNNYGSPSAGNGPYYCIFYAYSSGSNPADSTFYIENRTALAKGVYIAQWQSRWNAGTNYATTSLNVSIDGGVTTLLSYNDSATRDTGNYQPRSLIFEVKTDNSYLRWTFRDTQTTSNRLFGATIQGLTIQKYNGLTIIDPVTNAIVYLTSSVSQMNNVKMIGTNEITGTLSMVGLPSFLSNRGSQNVCLSSNFTQDAGSSISARNIAIGDIGYFGQDYQNNILIGMNSMSDGSSTSKGTSKQSVMISTDGAFTYQDDVVIGYGIKKGGTNGDCVLIGSLIGNNGTSSQPFLRCVAVGSKIWRSYFFQSGNNTPQDNVAVGSYSQGQSGDLIGGSFNTSVGSYSMTWIKGNINTQSYNTSVGYYSGADTTGNFNNYYGCSYFGALSKSTGNIANIKYATALGYNAITDASYCSVIGADASFNVPNSIRLGRPQDKTYISSLYLYGNADISGNINIDCGSVTWFGTRNYGVASLVYYIQNENVETRNILDSVGATANNALSTANSAQGTANSAQSKANDAYDLAAAAQATGTAAGVVAAGAAAASASNATAIAGLSASVTAQGTAITNLETSMTTEQSKTQYMRPASQNFTRSEFYNKVAIFDSLLSLSYGIQLDPSGTSTFDNGIDVKNINTIAGEVNNLRGSTINIGDSNGSVNIDCSFVSVGNVNGSSVTIGSENGNVEMNGGTITLGEGALYSTINLNGAVYINGLLYVPFSNYTGYLNNRW